MGNKWESDGMPSDQDGSKQVVVAVLLTFTFVGLIASGQENDAGVGVTWIWMGIGLSVTYLLYKVLVALERIDDSIEAS